MSSDLDYKQTALYDHYKSYNPKTLYDIYNNITYHYIYHLILIYLMILIYPKNLFIYVDIIFIMRTS